MSEIAANTYRVEREPLLIEDWNPPEGYTVFQHARVTSDRQVVQQDSDGTLWLVTMTEIKPEPKVIKRRARP